MRIKALWSELYGDSAQNLLDEFIEQLKKTRSEINLPEQRENWYKNVVVYSLYVDLFNKNFKGLTEKLDYISSLGITCIWLLPVLDSPMKDAGFDIRDYRKIREDLLGNRSNSNSDLQEEFQDFLNEAHRRNIKVIFDIAINHTSRDHYWFQESRKSPGNPYRNFYIWNKDDKKYSQCRLLFKGMCPSNWEKEGDWYYFHRFFEHQPDLNYKNPEVLLKMAENMVFWLKKGVDGFRADAIPYLWKEENTNCENLPKTHTIVKFFRAVLDFVRPNTLLLAEACQPPVEVVKYMGSGDECHAGYHFPLMPQIFKSLAMHSSEPVLSTLSPEITPEIPDSAQWFTFLRCHDELSLELVYVSEADRKYIHDSYCHNSQWDFRVGEGISARLAELMKKNPDKILLAFSIMLTLPGTPIIYYGDEFGKLNDESYYHEKIKETGHDDTRFLVRGPVDWEKLTSDLSNSESLSFKVYNSLKSMINTRNCHKCFGDGKIIWLKDFSNKNILAFVRQNNEERLLIVHNLADHQSEFSHPVLADIESVLPDDKTTVRTDRLSIQPYSFYWIKLKANEGE